MKKALITIFLLLLIGAAGGYFVYNLFTEQNKAQSAWQFLPPGAVLVLETHAAAASEEALESHPVLNGVRTLPPFARLQAQLVQLDSLSKGIWESGLANRSLLVGMLMTSRQDFDFLFISPLKSVDAVDWLRAWKQALIGNPMVETRRRNLRNTEVIEFLMPNGRFAFFVQNDILVASFSPLLLEDALRQWEDPRPVALSPISALGKEGDAPAFSSAPYTVHLNAVRFARLLQSFLPPEAERPFGDDWPYRLRLEPQVRQDWLLLNGFANKPDSLPGFLNVFKGQEPQMMAMAGMVPVRASQLYYYGFSEGGIWHRNLLNFWQKQNSEQYKAWLKLRSVEPALIDDLIDQLQQEVGVATLPRSPGVPAGKLVYIRLKNSQAVQGVNKLAELLHQANGDTVYTEAFREQQIGLLNYAELPAALFGQGYEGFPESYYLQQNNYLILANDVQLLKDLLLDQETDYTWRSSISMNRMLDKTRQEANVALYLNMPKLWPNLSTELSSTWQAWYGKNQAQLQAYDFLALQFSQLDRDFFANLQLHQAETSQLPTKEIRLAEDWKYSFPAPVQTPVFLVNGLQGRLSELLVQDTAGHIFSMQPGEQQMKMADSLGEHIQTRIYQPDMGKNGRPNYLFATDNQLRLYNADWQLRKNFPILPGSDHPIEFLQLIDYDGSKQYRFLLATAAGELFMYNAEGKALEGWNARNTGAPLAMAPGHVRVRARDVMYAFQKNGTLLLMNRRGQTYPGFPFKLKEAIGGEVAIRTATTFADSRLITVTEDGLLVEVDFEGKTRKKQQLYRPEADSRFWVVGDQRKENYLIIRQDRYRVAALNLQGQTLFEKELLTTSPLKAQYFHLNGANDLIVLRDPAQEFAYVLSREGELLSQQPIEASADLALQYKEKEKQYTLYVPYQQHLSRIKF